MTGDINPEGFLPPPAGCICGSLYTYGGHTEPGQLRPGCPVHSHEENQ